MKKIVRLAVVLILLVLAPTTDVSADTTIQVKQASLTGHACDSSVRQFNITGVTGHAPPASITVFYTGGTSEVVNLDQPFNGATAQYSTTNNLGKTVQDATAVIFDGWSGQFVLSHGPCPTTPTPTRTNTPTKTQTATVTKTNTSASTRSRTPTTTKTGSPTVTATVTSTAPQNTPTLTKTATMGSSTPTSTSTTPTATGTVPQNTPTGSPTGSPVPTATSEPPSTETLVIVVDPTSTTMPPVSNPGLVVVPSRTPLAGVKAVKSETLPQTGLGEDLVRWAAGLMLGGLALIARYLRSEQDRWGRLF